MSRQKVYVALSADILHHGHINIFNKASELGEYLELQGKSVQSKT